MRGPVFTVGRLGCNLSIKDHSMPSTLCELKQAKVKDIIFLAFFWLKGQRTFAYYIILVQHGAPSVASLEITGNGFLVQVNGKCYQKSSCVHLRGGDEVIFSVSGRHAYVSFLEINRFPYVIYIIIFWPFVFSCFLRTFLNCCVDISTSQR